MKPKHEKIVRAELPVLFNFSHKYHKFALPSKKGLKIGMIWK